MPVNGFREWEEVEFLYRSMKLYNGVLMSWMEQLLPSVVFSVCSSITILLYVTVRPSGLPFFVYVWFPLVGIVAICVVSWLVYDAVVIKRAAEQILGVLQSQMKLIHWGLSLDRRRELSRRARALRPIQLSFGNFSDVSLEVLANIWDEVLNQLLFLLSL